MAKQTLAVHGYRDLMRGLQVADRDTKKEIRAEFRKVGDTVRTDASSRLSEKDTRSAAGFKTRVRQRGIAVEQSLRKTTGQHPEWGSYQMRHALLPSLMENQRDLEHDLEHALDHVADKFNRGSVL